MVTTICLYIHIYTSKMVRLAIKRPTRITQTLSPYGGFFAKSWWKKMWLILDVADIGWSCYSQGTKNVLVKIGATGIPSIIISLQRCFFKAFNSSTKQWEFGCSGISHWWFHDWNSWINPSWIEFSTCFNHPFCGAAGFRDFASAHPFRAWLGPAPGRQLARGDLGTYDMGRLDSPRSLW